MIEILTLFENDDARFATLDNLRYDDIPEMDTETILKLFKIFSDNSESRFRLLRFICQIGMRSVDIPKIMDFFIPDDLHAVQSIVSQEKRKEKEFHQLQ